MSNELLQLLEAVAKGNLTPEMAVDRLQDLNFESVGDFAKIDRSRAKRTGFPEVIFGQGKTATQIIQIMNSMERTSSLVMATRVTESVYEQLQQVIPRSQYFATAQICCLGESQLRQVGTITIITAGTSDLPVAEEAAVTAELCGFTVKRLWDVGVAGVHRLLRHQALITEAEVLIVVAGMEGALASVVGGLANCPVIAVPTSVGYGASFNGLAPLLAMLNSCAAGVGVVNIDNGFGAAILAGQILRLAYKQK